MSNEEAMKLEGREFDVAVAQRVFGHEVVRWGDFYAIAGNPQKPDGRGKLIGAGTSPSGKKTTAYAVPQFHADAGADYTVLQHVRATWDTARLFEFGHHLNRLWEGRLRGLPLGGELRNCGIPSLVYEPGDYSRAALAAARLQKAAAAVQAERQFFSGAASGATPGGSLFDEPTP